MNGTIMWNEASLKVQLSGEYGQIIIAKNFENEWLERPATYLFLNEGKVVAIESKKIPKVYDRVLVLHPEWTIESEYLLGFLRNYAHNNQWLTQKDKQTIPSHFEKLITPYMDELVSLLEWLGYSFSSHQLLEKTQDPIKKSGKPQHRWSKEVSTIPFMTDYKGTKATIYWHKRNEMLIKAGAHLLAAPPLNKDGSLGFSARFGLKIREEQAASFNDQLTTTKDIVVKSVNEVGLFLYFAGTNSWLQFKDETGKTIEEWTVVN